ncbi:MAG: oxidoreductase, partial [Verrucomicrobia bacterium]
VTALLEEMPVLPDAHYYLCGLESMIAETSSWLEEQGVDLFHIHREVFFHG